MCRMLDRQEVWVRRRQTIIAVAASLAALLSVVALAGCGTREAGATGTPSPSTAPGTTAYTNKEFGFTLHYDSALLPFRETVRSRGPVGPAIPARWKGAYVRSLFDAAGSIAGNSPVLNVGLLNRSSGTVLFISASHLWPHASQAQIAYALRAGNVVEAALRGQSAKSRLFGGHLPPTAPVIVNALHGYRLTFQKPGHDFTGYVLYGRVNEYFLLLDTAHAHTQRDLPALEAIVRSFHGD